MTREEKLKKLKEQAQALLAKETLTDEERGELARLTAEAQKLQAEIEAESYWAEDEPEDGDEDGDDGDGEDAPEAAAPVAATAKSKKGRKAMKYRDIQNGGGAPATIRSRSGGFKIDSDAPLQSAIVGLRRGEWDKVIFPLFPLKGDALKALSEGTTAAGGHLVPVEQSTGLIELLRAKAVVRRAGATVIPMNTDSLTIPSQTGGATAYWVAENAQITASDQTFGQVSLAPNKLAALTKLSAELFADSDPAIEAIVRADLARVLALEEDIKYLRGDGTGNTPTGLLNISGVNVDASTLGVNGSAPDFDDLLGMIYNLDADNAPQEGRAWIVNPRTVKTLRAIKDSQNRYIWSDPAAPGDPPTVWGYPVFTTTAIPINLTVGTSVDTSEIYFGSWPEFIVGQRKTLELRASDEAGNAFEYDQVFIRAIMRVDCNVRHAASFEILTGVRE